MIVLGHISLKIFDLVFAMTGPDNARTVVPGILVYTKGFRENAFAKAAAIAVIMLFLVALIIIPYLWTQLRERRDR
jgi:glucose/mannose transport system permease protein